MIAASVPDKRRLGLTVLMSEAVIAMTVVMAAAIVLFAPSPPIAYGAEPAFQLQTAEPAPGSWVHTGPDRLVLQFSAPVLPEQSRIVVTSYREGNVPGRLEREGPSRLIFIPDVPLPEATYEVMWEAVSEAGSREEGRYSFTYLVPKDDWEEPLDRRLINRLLGNALPGWVLIIPAVAGVGGLVWVAWNLFRS